MSTESRDWMVGAACRAHPIDMFFPHPQDFRAQNLAINVCRDCPVRPACETYAEDNDTTHGVWAGRFYNDMTSRRGYRPCGTEAAYKRHNRNGETCAVCRTGMSEIRRQRRAMQ